jgi:outer membrane protein OmpA-like peptidoglycan-associated protein
MTKTIRNILPSLLFTFSLFTFNFSFSQQTILIHFDFDKSAIRAESASTLDSFFTPQRNQNIVRIELYGHCDYIGNHTYNDALSERRVAETKSYLVGKGLNENLFVKEGFGKRKPLNDNSTAEQRLQNRRVEIIVHLNDSTTPATENKTPTLTEIIKDTARKGNIILRNLNFQGGRHYLLPQSQPVLDELYRVMADNPTLAIQIEGHVCCTPDNADGLDIDLQTYDLSVQRAKAIYGYLVQRGIAPERLSYTGFGGARKLYRYENDEFERQENRRVELKILSR